MDMWDFTLLIYDMVEDAGIECEEDLEEYGETLRLTIDSALSDIAMDNGWYYMGG